MKKENKSLITYTALIFLISIIMILIAFVGQNNTQSMQPETDASGVSITDKVNQLSEENRLLLEERIRLTRENETLVDENSLLYNLLKMDSLLKEERKDEALLIYNTIDPSLLTELQMVYYNDITERLEQFEEE